MPFQSEKQRRYLWANEPEIARDWTDTYGSGIAKALGGRIGMADGMSPAEAQARGLGAQHHGSVTSANLHAGNVGEGGGHGNVPGIGIVKAPVPKKEGILNVKNINRAQKGLDAHALWNMFKTKSLNVNPWAWAANYGLDRLGSKKGKSQLQTNFGEDEDEMTIEELRDYFEGINREDFGLPQPASVDWEDYMEGKVADQSGILGVDNNLMAGPIGNYAQQAVANQVLGQSYGVLDPFQQQQVNDAINTYGTTSLGTLKG